MNTILSYHEGKTLLHRANPLSKLVLAMSVVIAAFITSDCRALVVLALLIVLTMYSAHILSALRSLLKAILILSCVMFCLQSMLNQGGTHLFLWITDAGLISALRAALRLFCFALPLVSMLSVTKLNDLANACVVYLHIPYCYAFTITTAIRFVPIFAYEMTQISEAQMARGVQFDTPNPYKKLKLMMPLIIPLLVSSVRKADMCALAAEQRGFYLRTAQSSYKTYPFLPQDGVLFLVSFMLIAAACAFSLL